MMVMVIVMVVVVVVVGREKERSVGTEGHASIRCSKLSVCENIVKAL